MGAPQWAESRLAALQALPWVPVFETSGITSAAKVQWTLLVYWTGPMIGLWLGAALLGLLTCELQFQHYAYKIRVSMRPTGNFWGVVVYPQSIGNLPLATTPSLEGNTVSLTGAKGKSITAVHLQGKVKEAFKLLTVPETKFCEEVIQILVAKPDHFAGLGHGVGLLEHTFNVVSESATRCTPEFRLPLLAALCHDIGKLITFRPDGNGGWARRGLHSRESARIIATLPSFQELPQLHRNALLLAIKYDHNPNKMPDIEGNKEASMLAMRVISALAQSDRQATAGEKERHLEKLQPEDLLWKDFVDFLREAPVVQLGKPGVSNQLNNPSNSEYLYVYEAAWREAAIKRMPEEVAAALDLNRRDAGKLAKYTKVLAARLRKDGLLLESTKIRKPDGTFEEVSTSEANPLWDIQSGTGEKGQVIRGVLVLHASALWALLNFKLGVRSPYPVTVLAPNADPEGKVRHAPSKHSSEVPDMADTMKVAGDDPSLYADATKPAGKPPKRRGFGAPQVTRNDEVVGLAKPQAPKPAQPVAEPAAQQTVPVPAPAPTTPDTEVASPVTKAAEGLTEEEQMAAELDALAGASENAAEPDERSGSVDMILSWLPKVDELAVVSGEQGADDSPPTAIAPVQAKVPHTAVVVSADSPLQPAKLPAPAKPKSAVDARRGALKSTEDQSSEGLTKTEGLNGFALADEAAVKKYPHLKLGDKYHTAKASAVKAGQVQEGALYQPPKLKSSFEQSTSIKRRRPT